MTNPAGALVRWAPAMATMAVVCITLSMSMPLFSLLLERLGASGTEIGLNQMVAALAMVVRCLSSCCASQLKGFSRFRLQQ